MSHLQPIPRERRTAAQSEAYDYVAAAGSNPDRGPWLVYLRAPDYMTRHREMMVHLEKRAAYPRARQLMVMVAIRYWRAAYPWAAQVAVASKMGIAPAIIDAIAAGRLPELGDPHEDAAVRLAKEMLEQKKVSEETYARALHLFGEAGLVDLILTLGMITTTSMSCVAFDIDPPNGS